MNKLHDLAQLGQAIWMDDLQRAYLTGGQLQRWVDLGLTGETSNPTIFEKAIVGSADYDDLLQDLARKGHSPDEIFQALALRDIAGAADVFRPVYDATGGKDGFISMEVRPSLAYKTEDTIEEVTRLFGLVDRPNLMIKIPATDQGIPAIRACLGRGINVNITLIFSLAMYDQVLEAWLSGLEDYAACGGDLKRLASVASFFVSRVDTIIDKQLHALIDREAGTPRANAAAGLLGKIGIANARLAYARFQETLASDRWRKLAAQGAQPQRPLWASTSVKDPAYPDTMYVDNLIGPHTVNTVPPKTLAALQDHGVIARTIDVGVGEARRQLLRLAELGISLDEATQTLQTEGVASFAKSYDTLLKSVADKAAAMAKAPTAQPAATSENCTVQLRLGEYAGVVEAALDDLARQDTLARILRHDHTVWRDDPTEISNRLGWLDIAERMLPTVPRLTRLAQDLKAEGYTHALLLGMGGSSLAPEVLRKTFGVKHGALDLHILDSTDPAVVLRYTRLLDPSRTLFIVSTKSGGTVETLSFFRYFYNWTAAVLGLAEAGKHFIAITDPGSGLVDVAAQHHFRDTFINDPNIGGRYSALSFFGMVPAALTGLDVARLLNSAVHMAQLCAQTPAQENPAAQLGVIMGELANAQRDKLTFITSPAICSFGDWVEQLIAESTGKQNAAGQGVGILPVVGGAVVDPSLYAGDRLFVYLRLAGDHTHDLSLIALEDAGQPVVDVEVADLYDLGGQFYLWELAIAIAGARMGIQPFDQPNVEAAKVQARKVADDYREQGRLPEPKPTLQSEQVSVYGAAHDAPVENLGDAWRVFLDGLQPGDYLAVQAYLPAGEDLDASLLALRGRLLRRTRLAVTTGYGPRFLHSTGQLHKGDAGRGRFIQITHDHPLDAAIPEQAGQFASAMSFGVLELAQALGDRQALESAGRKVLRFHITGDVLVGLERIIAALP